MLTNSPGPSKALLVLPWRRVQNANAISSPMTWGFPSITAFTGLMIALQRRLEADGALDKQYRRPDLVDTLHAEATGGPPPPAWDDFLAVTGPAYGRD